MKACEPRATVFCIGGCTTGFKGGAATSFTGGCADACSGMTRRFFFGIVGWCGASLSFDDEATAVEVVEETEELLFLRSSFTTLLLFDFKNFGFTWTVWFNILEPTTDVDAVAFDVGFSDGIGHARSIALTFVSIAYSLPRGKMSSQVRLSLYNEARVLSSDWNGFR